MKQLRAITPEEYELLREKETQFQTFKQFAYAKKLDSAWKKKAGNLYTSLTGKIENIECPGCVKKWFGLLSRIYFPYQSPEPVTINEVPHCDDCPAIDVQTIETLVSKKEEDGNNEKDSSEKDSSTEKETGIKKGRSRHRRV